MSKLNPADYIGKQYGRLTVIDVELKSVNNRKHQTWFYCKCVCGNERWMRADRVKGGNAKSCGCGQREAVSKVKYTHGMSNSRLYHIWENMKRRCSPNYEQCKYYNEKGITVCEEWQSFEPFRDWSLENGYTDELTIDRKDGNKGYSPDNCRWTTATVQLRNQGMKEANTSGHKGVSWDKNRWVARIRIDYKDVYLGRYESIEDAIAARGKAELQLWGNER